jgi:hypothetical protein
MYIKNFTIAGGNKTTLVWNFPAGTEHTITQAHLCTAEQVGFVGEHTPLRLSMMGDELCINAMLALAAWSDVTYGVLHASGVGAPISYTNTKTTTSITLALPYTIQRNIVRFEGIGFVCSRDQQTPPTKGALKKLASHYNLPAFGSIFYTEDAEIHPTIYVQKTDSLVHESACGSGSIAIHLLTNQREIIQPTGEKICISHTENIFTVETVVAESA